MISLGHALGREVSFGWVVDHLKAGFSEYLGVSLRPMEFNKKEMKAILKIQEERYENHDWTFGINR